ncbi:MAG TPA: chemotaxis protein [Bacillota bacterium]|nr:chemotaxis protein [Bacillota bacterium]
MKEQEGTGILLESGTNELEIVGFGIGENHFGINVAKVREILEPSQVTKLPHSHPSISGIIQLRGEVLPVIDLSQALKFPSFENKSKGYFIVTEFNKVKVVFHVESVFQIHRISWEQIEKPTELFKGGEGVVIGVIKMPSQLILLLDFEKIVVEIDPDSGIQIDSIKKLGNRERINKSIVVAEDSPMLRKMIEETLVAAGYSNNHFFHDGKQAWDFLEKLAKEKPDDINNQVNLLITDIEMPQMDGLHLTKRVKDHPNLKDIPVIIFSSLISDDLRHKGERVGANGQVSKPEIDSLVQLIDQLVV